MFCRYCGNELNDNDNFCAKCGKPVNEESQPSNDTTYDIDISSFGNNRIEAVKYVSHTYNLSLSEAKKIVDEQYKKQAPSAPIQRTPKSFCCPKCKGTDIDLVSTDKNMKTKKTTSLNLNPLKPFTVFNHNEKQKEKTSAGKLALGFMTGGASLLVTGTKNKKHTEYFCRNCGHRWIGK